MSLLDADAIDFWNERIQRHGFELVAGGMDALRFFGDLNKTRDRFDRCLATQDVVDQLERDLVFQLKDAERRGIVKKVKT